MEDKWGIDLIGRKMWYEPWPSDVNGLYRDPNQKEIEEIYGISGEAVEETLLYFEECGGDTDKLINLLNDHIIDESFIITRNELLNKSRWYNSEYYFYFIMFTKKGIGRYDFHFGEEKNEQLSLYPKIWEKGLIEFKPWGENVHDQSLINNLVLISYFEDKFKLDIENVLIWINSVLPRGYEVNRSFYDMEGVWVSAEKVMFFYEFLKIVSNSLRILFEGAKYGVIKKVRNARLFLSLPKSLIATGFVRATSTTNNVYSFKYKLKKGLFCIYAENKNNDIIKQFSVFHRSCLNSNVQLASGAFHCFPSIAFEVEGNIDVKYEILSIGEKLSYKIIYTWLFINSKTTIVIITWLLIIVLLVLTGKTFPFLKNTNLIFLSIVGAITPIVIFSLRNKNIRLSQKMKILHEASYEQLNSLEKTSSDLIKEKQSLEQRVEERTFELAEVNDKLHELDKLKSNFFANISHEIRTPLTLILSPIESVIQGDYGNKVDKKFFENLQRNAIRLLKLINNLLDFSKIEAGHMHVKIQETDAVKFVKAYVGSIHSAAENKGIELSFVALNDSCNLFVDKDKADKILMNLFSNALKFTERGGNIKVSVKDDDKHCYIEFADTGVGIPEDKIITIFDRFGQADTSSTRKFEGTGIGLALAKEFADLHGGSISVTSKYIDEYPQDHGTTFKVTFLKGKEHFNKLENIEFVENEELDESIPDHRFAGMREMGDLKTGKGSDESQHLIQKSEHYIDILVVEDNPDMRNFLKFLLQDHYTVHLAVNGEDGLRKAGELKPDLIVSDVMMPIMNGYEMTQKIKEDEILKRIPVLMLTAKAEIANKIEGLEFGADDYLTKPFNSKELLTRIKSLLKINLLQKELIDLNRDLESKVKEQLAVIMKGDELKRYLPPQLVESIINGEKHVEFENERRKLTIFFSDIKGFTDTTDSMEAEELSSLLNEYLTEMTKIAHKHGGTIDKFIGDAIMIFFGAPELISEKEQAIRCVNMAIEMQSKMKELKRKWFKSGIEYPLEIRIGINTGTATVGNFGAEDRLSYTVIGGKVNLASRLEGLCNPGGILISHSTWAQIQDTIQCQKRGKVQVKGIHREILVYDVVMEED